MQQQIAYLHSDERYDLVRQAVFERTATNIPDIAEWSAHPPRGWLVDGGPLSLVGRKYQRRAAVAWGTHQLWKKLVSDLSCAQLFSPSAAVRMSHCRPCGFMTTKRRTFTCDRGKLCPFCYGRRLLALADYMVSEAPGGLWYSFVAHTSNAEITRYFDLVRRTLKPRRVDGYRFFRMSGDLWVTAHLALASGWTQPPSVEDAPPWERVKAGRTSVNKVLVKACGYPWQILRPKRSEEAVALFKMSRRMRDSHSVQRRAPDVVSTPTDLTAGGFISEPMRANG